MGAYEWAIPQVESEEVVNDMGAAGKSNPNSNGQHFSDDAKVNQQILDLYLRHRIRESEIDSLFPLTKNQASHNNMPFDWRTSPSSVTNIDPRLQQYYQFLAPQVPAMMAVKTSGEASARERGMENGGRRRIEPIYNEPVEKKKSSWSSGLFSKSTKFLELGMDVHPSLHPDCLLEPAARPQFCEAHRT